MNISTAQFLTGSSPCSAEEIAEAAFRGRHSSLPGDYVVGTVEADGRECLITSCLSALPYYIAEGPGGVVHGPDLFEIARRAHLPWIWNERAVRCLALLGHTLGTDTLHARVSRVPSASVVTLGNGGWRVDEQPFWSALDDKTPSGSADASLASLLTAFKDLHLPGDGEAVLSLSAGYDSRLLLALCQHLGLRLRTVTMGTPDATDAVVGAALARAAALPHHRLELRAEDYVPAATAIARATGGAKLANSWHTFLYSREAGPISVNLRMFQDFGHSVHLQRPPTPIHGEA